MISNIEIFLQDLHFKQSFQIAYEKVDFAPIIVVKITDSSGHYGLGSASPDEEVTGENVDQSLKILRTKFNKKFFDEPLGSWYYYHEKIQKTFSGSPAAQSAAEEALLNLWAKKNKLPLSIFFGGYRKQCPIMFTIGIKGIRETTKEAREVIRKGFQIIKVKCGLDLTSDIQKAIQLRKMVPKKVKLAFDANQGYTFNQAKQFLGAVAKIKAVFVEQPIRAADWQGLKKLSLLNQVPVIADESAADFQKSIKILSGGYANGINIKLMKCGGPINCLKIFHLAQSLKKITLLGCMYESNISITTGAALALALPFDYIDLDSGHLDFDDDPAVGGALVKQGQISLAKQPLKLRGIN